MNLSDALSNETSQLTTNMSIELSWKIWKERTNHSQGVYDSIDINSINNHSWNAEHNSRPVLLKEYSTQIEREIKEASS